MSYFPSRVKTHGHKTEHMEAVMTIPAHRRHDISDRVRGKIEHLPPGRKGSRGGIAQDNRRFVNALFRIMRTGSPWHDLPPDYGGWSNTHCRSVRWRDKGIWERLLETLAGESDCEWPTIDASHCKVHPHAAGAAGGNRDMSRAKGGSTQNCI